MIAAEQHGMVRLRSVHSFADTLAKLEAILAEKSIRIFCRIDHSGEAARAGIQMNPTFLLIFGAPEAGTPLMIEAPTLALDLPLKVLISEDDDGAVWITQNSVAYLQSRHAVLSEAAPLDAAIRLITKAAGSESHM